MKTRVLFNPKAGTAERWPELRDKLRAIGGEVELVESRGPDEMRRYAAGSAHDQVARVIAVGGDGTTNAIVNGLMESKANHPTLGIVPLGTGNDLPRTLGLPLDPTEAIDVIAANHVRRIDLIRAKSGDFEGYCHNVAAGGFTGQMNEALDDDTKARWGPLAYLRGAIKVLPDLTHYQTSIRYDGRAWEPVHALNVIVANGRTAGGGTVVAPQADPSDGLLDVVIVRPGTLVELAGVAARLLAGDYTSSDLVTHHRVRRVEIRSTPGMWFNIDGELVTNEPIAFSVIKSVLDVIVPADAAPTRTRL